MVKNIGDYETDVSSIGSSLERLIEMFSIQYIKAAKEIHLFDFQSKTSCCEDSWRITQKREVIHLLSGLFELIEDPENAQRILDEKKEWIQDLLPLLKFSRTIRRISSSEIRENCLPGIEIV